MLIRQLKKMILQDDQHGTKMKKIPYGISSFETIKTDNYYYVDNTYHGGTESTEHQANQLIT